MVCASLSQEFVPYVEIIQLPLPSFACPHRSELRGWFWHVRNARVLDNRKAGIFQLFTTGEDWPSLHWERPE